MVLAALTLAALFVGFVCWFGYQLLKQNGRILAQLEALQAAVEGTPAFSLAKSRIKRDGLAPGTEAPDFRIPRVDGGELSLSDYRGQRVVLVFSDPQCGPCMTLAPRIEQQSRRTDVQVVMVSRGDPAVNRAKVAEQRLTFPVGLQRQWEISRSYAMFATPIAYLVDEDGVIAAPVAIGPDAILAMLARSARTRDFSAIGVEPRGLPRNGNHGAQGEESWNIGSISWRRPYRVRCPVVKRSGDLAAA